VEGGSSEDAGALWHSVLEIVDEARVAGGFLDRGRLLGRLRCLHRLRDLPDYRDDWNRLRDWSRRARDTVPSRIGGTVVLPRTSELLRVQDQLSDSKAVVILGSPGMGKTVIAKLYSEQVEARSMALWFGAEDLKGSGLGLLRSSLGLSHPIADILPSLTQPEGLVVIDGLERLVDRMGFHELATCLCALEIGQPASPWRLLVTCQAEHWKRVEAKLRSHLSQPPQWSGVQVAEPCEEELELVWQSFPSLRDLAQRPQLGSLLKQPKILDLLASAGAAGELAESEQWVGESDLIDWFWNSIVRQDPDGDVKSRFLQLLAGQQADTGLFETPITELESADVAQIAPLSNTGICGRHEERVSFKHDLVGDWARQRSILAHVDTVVAYLERRVIQPHWHRAIRLYGLHLLEQRKDTTEWRDALTQLPFAQDLLLDSTVFAANGLALLERVWADLESDNGALLRRLLARFRQVATYPDPVLAQLAETLDAEALACSRAEYRLPLVCYWPQMLLFLHRHLDRVVELALPQVAKLVETWLSAAKPSWPCQREAAELAVAVGEAVYELRKRQVLHDPTGISQACYRATLSAAHELPDEVASLALRACARTPPGAQALLTAA